MGVQDDGTFVPGELGIGLVEGIHVRVRVYMYIYMYMFVYSVYMYMYILFQIIITLYIILLLPGYDSMGFELSKPKLRSEMESNLAKYCT